ncbi:lysophospholipid acyltransferase family protein [Nonomuraea soli]|uniref:1-acyl-sn-glycerol-3-phosphate acyltransferase n=1 Tax=Nonomuraea soli TaxID=1032476 RepID=A0A7W0HPY8_9ACTN|nr:lysophospholipid acyltransferase family protein [Nonomuraea soli]MBA2891353.1 1-acyl-sn-glycerol-3-phosphate acyltransferase [Nonomuraea soli]
MSWFPTSPCTPQACIQKPSRPASWVRRLVRVLAAVSVVAAALVVRGTSPAWSRALVRALGIRIEVRRGFAVYGGAGWPREVGGDGSALIVANHISWLDPLVMAAALGGTPLAKQEVATWPLIGGLVRRSGALFIVRGSLHALPEAVARVSAALREGRSVAAFPEGTTWCGRGGGTFRPAVFQAALDAGVPVRPVALAYREDNQQGSTAAAYIGQDSLLSSVFRMVSVRRLTIQVTVLPPLTAVDRRHLARAAEAAVVCVTGQAVRQTGRVLHPSGLTVG